MGRDIMVANDPGETGCAGHETRNPHGILNGKRDPIGISVVMRNLIHAAFAFGCASMICLCETLLRCHCCAIVVQAIAAEAGMLQNGHVVHATVIPRRRWMMPNRLTCWTRFPMLNLWWRRFWTRPGPDNDCSACRRWTHLEEIGMKRTSYRR